MQYAIKAAQQLAKTGKKPSVGLVRAKLPKGYPLPKIIAALNQWQDHPDVSDALPAATHPTAISGDELDLRIHQHIASAVMLLTQEIAELRSEINQLKQHTQSCI